MGQPVYNSITAAQDFAAKLRAKDLANQPGQAGVEPHYVEDPDVAFIVENTIKTGRNCFIWGPPGTGKTCLVQNVAARLGREVLEFNCDGETSTENLIGKLWRDANGEIVVKYGVAVQAWRDGKILLLNEPDRAVADIMSALYQFLEVKRKFVTVNIGDVEVFYRSPEYACVATGNTNGNLVDAHLHAGSKQLPQAFIDRFSWFPRMSYLDPHLEVDVLVNKTGIDPVSAKTLVSIAGETRISDDLEKKISTRDLLDWSENIVTTGWDALKAAQYSFLQTYTEEEQGLIREIVEGKL